MESMMNQMIDALRSASTETEFAEEAMMIDRRNSRRASASNLASYSTTPTARPKSMTACDLPREVASSGSFNPATMALPTVSLPFLAPRMRSPRSQAAIEKCIAAIAECRAVLAERKEDESSDACHDDDLLEKIALRAGQAQRGRHLSTGRAEFNKSLPSKDMTRWLDDTPGEPPAVASLPLASRSLKTGTSSTAAPPSPESVVVKKALRDASWENAAWEFQTGKPREFRKKTFLGSLWPKPSAKMLMEVEARGC
ncbi:hypothetical protein T484DRAFT_1957529 [Baffinella frigidus]|nr:hypothetical protein T484DRAFT_1957529 [Cryptophyta sp. CCMP2293]